jgi:2-polyprenyl-6-methoxyphenol hydroxylase-like FAD-dependent oxidoreductase
MSDLPETTDVLIAGGGSAGAVLAARLSQEPARTVLLEASPAYGPERAARRRRIDHPRDPSMPAKSHGDHAGRTHLPARI